MAESNRMFDLITPFLTQAQDIETMLNDLRELRDIDNATGAQLDGVGDIVDLPRGTLTDDEDYRTALRLKNDLNLSAGQPDTLNDYVKSVAGSGIEYREPFPGNFVFYINLAVDFKTLRDTLQQLKPAAVSFHIYYIDPAHTPFNTADENGFSSPGAGFLELDYPEAGNGYTAGALSELI